MYIAPWGVTETHRFKNLLKKDQLQFRDSCSSTVNPLNNSQVWDGAFDLCREVGPSSEVIIVLESPFRSIPLGCCREFGCSSESPCSEVSLYCQLSKKGFLLPPPPPPPPPVFYTPIPVQRWARAYRDENYHAAIDTNNGTEAQNKLFKYSFLPRKKYTATLSNTVSIIVESFLPTRRQQYLLQNYQQSSMYRSYQSYIAPFLHNRPRSVILHCLDRTNSSKILPQHVHDIDTAAGIFEVEKTSGGKHMVDFGLESPSQMPSCTCKDWVRHHLPCKHFFSIFTNRQDWGWDKRPSGYLQSAYLSTDERALDDFFQPHENTMVETGCPSTDLQITEQLQRPRIQSP